MSRIKKENQSPATRPTGGKLGRVSIGQKVKNDRGATFPTSLDHFVITPKAAILAPALEQYIAETKRALKIDSLTSLLICFQSNDTSAVCAQRLELWDGAKLAYWTDNETVYRARPATKDVEGGFDQMPVSELGMPLEVFKARICEKLGARAVWKEALYLRFSLYNFNALGYWELTTHAAKSSIPALIEAFDTCRDRLGSVVGLPFLLSVEKVKTIRAGDSTQYSVLSLLPLPSKAQAAIIAPNPTLELGSGSPIELLDTPHADDVF